MVIFIKQAFKMCEPKNILTLVILVLYTCFTEVTSQIIISEIKLWGEQSSQFIELYNTLTNDSIPLSANYSLLILDDPEINTNTPLKVYSVIDLSNYTTINASEYLSVHTPDISKILDVNMTFSGVLYKIEENSTELKKDDDVMLANIEDAVVFNHDGTKLITFLSYKLKQLDNNVLLNNHFNNSLSRCVADGMEGLFKVTAVSKGEANIDVCPVEVVTPSATTTPLTQTTVGKSTETSVSVSTETTSTTVDTGTTTDNNTTTTTLPPTSSPVAPVTGKSTEPTYITTAHNLTINELNIMMGENTHTKFIELHGPSNAKFENVQLKLMNETDVLLEHNITETDEKGLHVVNLNKEYNMKLLAVVLFDDGKVVDGFIISQNGDSVAQEFVEKYSPVRSIFFFNPKIISIPDGKPMSISKCGYFGDVSGGFMLTIASQNKKNNCTTNFHQKIQLKLIDGDCKIFRNNIALKKEIAYSIVRRTSKECQCGLSSIMFQEQSIHCGSVIFEAYIRTVTKEQLDTYTQVYKSFINTTKTLTIDEKTYKVNSTCYQDCYIHKEPTVAENNDSVNVTVAVVVTCIVVFIIIVLVVILYLKKKRNGLLQFSMIRLEEDNGLLMDDSKGVRFQEGSAIIM